MGNTTLPNDNKDDEDDEDDEVDDDDDEEDDEVDDMDEGEEVEHGDLTSTAAANELLKLFGSMFNDLND